MSGADTADAALPRSELLHATSPLGHERLPFVAPRTYLEQGRPMMPPRALTAADREQLDGLVSKQSDRSTV